MHEFFSKLSYIISAYGGKFNEGNKIEFKIDKIVEGDIDEEYGEQYESVVGNLLIKWDDKKIKAKFDIELDIIDIEYGIVETECDEDEDEDECGIERDESKDVDNSENIKYNDEFNAILTDKKQVSKFLNNVFNLYGEIASTKNRIPKNDMKYIPKHFDYLFLKGKKPHDYNNLFNYFTPSIWT